MMRSRLLDAVEGGGAMLFALCGIVPLPIGRHSCKTSCHSVSFATCWRAG